WVEAIKNTCATFENVAPNTRAWFLLDREGDGAHTVSTLDQSEHWFTVRANHDRRLVGPSKRSKRPRFLRKELSKSPARGDYDLPVSAAPSRQARLARMTVRWLRVTLRMRDKATGETWPVTLTAISTREVGTTPPGESPLHWILLTNHPVESLD